MSRAEPESGRGRAPSSPGASDPPRCLRQEVVVRQSVGTHLRVVKRIHERVATLDAEVYVSTPLHRAHAGSVLDLMQLAARPGDRVAVEGRGPDAARALRFVVGLLHATRWDAEVPDA